MNSEICEKPTILRMANSLVNHTSAFNKDDNFYLIFNNQQKFVAGKAIEFHFATKSEDLSLLKINVLGPSRCKIKHYTIRDGLYGVSFVPLNPGSYMVIIKWKGAEIEESPIICSVSERENIFLRRPSFRRGSMPVYSTAPLPRKFKT